nr:dethiobiotin synthase [Allopusillimonas ginsengisoli]
MTDQQTGHGTEVNPKGVFVTGTDTDVGKTFVSAVLAKAWGADYWKPYQTGVVCAQGDTETVAALLGEGREDSTGKPWQGVLHAPVSVLQAPLAPWDAARQEGVDLDAGTLRLPVTDAPLVVEGAGGLYVPVDEAHMMIDLAAMLALPVVLVARSTLGTINHTLLSLHALRTCHIPVLGVVMNGPPSAGNREAIERFGHTPVIAEIPHVERPDHHAVSDMAARIQALADLSARMRA